VSNGWLLNSTPRNVIEPHMRQQDAPGRVNVHSQLVKRRDALRDYLDGDRTHLTDIRDVPSSKEKLRTWDVSTLGIRLIGSKASMDPLQTSSDANRVLLAELEKLVARVKLLKIQRPKRLSKEKQLAGTERELREAIQDRDACAARYSEMAEALSNEQENHASTKRSLAKAMDLLTEMRHELNALSPQTDWNKRLKLVTSGEQ
jgi:hypothetical protein